MKSIKKSRGFTVLELLVVIAIIGILAAIIITSIQTARRKGDEAVVISTMDTIRKQAELYYSNNGRYGAPWVTPPVAIGGNFGDGVTTFYRNQQPRPCFPDSFWHNDNTVVTAITKIMDLSTFSFYGGAYDAVLCGMTSDGQKWAFAAMELGVGYSRYCIDWSGQTKKSSNSMTNVINSTTMKCI